MWNDAVVTNAGRAILEKWSGGGTLTIDYAKSGGGTVPAAALMAQTEITDEKEQLSIASVQALEDGTQFKIQITAAESGYTARQIGIFAHLNSEAPVLLALYQDETGTAIPAASDMPDFVFSFYGIVEINNTGDMDVTIDPNALVSNSTLLDYGYQTAEQVAEAIAGAGHLSGGDFAEITEDEIDGLWDSASGTGE